jgi:hypothetical protein
VKRTVSLKLLLIAFLSITNTACSGQTIPLQTIFSSNNCAIREPVLRSIDSASELDHFFQSLAKKISISPPLSLEIDFRKQVLILFALGQKPTSGFAIELEKKFARLRDGKLYLPVSIREPDEGSFQAQLITSPCRIFSIPKTDFAEIRIANE